MGQSSRNKRLSSKQKPCGCKPRSRSDQCNPCKTDQGQRGQAEPGQHADRMIPCSLSVAPREPHERTCFVLRGKAAPSAYGARKSTRSSLPRHQPTTETGGTSVPAWQPCGPRALKEVPGQPCWALCLFLGQPPAIPSHHPIARQALEHSPLPLLRTEPRGPAGNASLLLLPQGHRGRQPLGASPGSPGRGT